MSQMPEVEFVPFWCNLLIYGLWKWNNAKERSLFKHAQVCKFYFYQLKCWPFHDHRLLFVDEVNIAPISWNVKVCLLFMYKGSYSSQVMYFKSILWHLKVKWHLSDISTRVDAPVSFNRITFNKTFHNYKCYNAIYAI